MVAQGIIEPAGDQPSPWCHPLSGCGQTYWWCSCHHRFKLNKILSRCRTHGITLNAEKFVIASPTVSFCGYTLSENGFAADEEKVRAISEFPKPANLTDLRSFMGFTNQLTDFSPDLPAAADPLRLLMSPMRSFTWTADHDAAFASDKKALSQPPVLAHFDPRGPPYYKRMLLVYMV
ncbi:uncharacterized protein [Palaemon carinicauda]|uniref:uncharacterized protein n=1 Tax=Palaemon carinicauda TaxID=392227 RepID=UPI0035B5D111